MKSFKWVEFISKIPVDSVIAVSQDFLYNARFYTEKQRKISANKIELFNGPYCDYTFSADFNRRVKFVESLKYFDLATQIFDYEETGEFEEGFDGIEIPVLQKSNTFKIKTINVYILEAKKF